MYDISSIYGKAILAGTLPAEERKHATVDILTKKSQEKVKLGGNFEEACPTKVQIQEVNIEESRKLKAEHRHHRNVGISRL